MGQGHQREINIPHYIPNGVCVKMEGGFVEVNLNKDGVSVGRFWLPADVARALEEKLRAQQFAG